MIGRKRKKVSSGLHRSCRTQPMGKYATANLVIKMLKYNLPMDLNDALHKTLFTERRRSQKAKFFDSSKSK